MSKIERLNARVAKLLTAAVHEVLEVVRETVSEYQEKTARTQRENESLRRRLRELQDKVKTVGTVTIQPIVLSGSGKRDLIEQEWSPSRRQGTELTPTEEKQEFSEEHKTRQSEVELGAIESDHMAESETECGLLSHDLNVMGSMCAARITDTDLSEFRPHPVENDSNLTAVSVHTVNISTTLSPNTSILSVLPSLASDEIKTEPPEYTASQRHTTQSPIQDCSDSNTNIAQNDTSIEAPRQNNSESYGLLHIHSNYSTFGKRFAFGKNVRSTLDKKHKQYYRKEAEHRCILCGKTFSRIGNLRIHQRCHTGEKPYCCVQCGRCFSQAGDLKKHKRVHTGEKPYYCTQCGKSFSRGENLKRHQKIHIGETLHLHQVWREPQSNEIL